jgi:uncharacterized protein YraI
MKSKTMLLGTLGFLTLTILACNITRPSPSSGNQQQSAIDTVVAQTMQAVASQPVNTILGTPVEVSTPSATQTAVKAILTINQNTNCRSGPSADSKIITAFTPGTALEIVGKDSADDFWLVKIPNTEDTCWASGQYAAPSGGYSNVPDVTPTASVVNGVPAEPGNLTYGYFCGSLTEATVTLSWTDVATDETGYRVYRDSTLLAELPANSTTYTDNTSRVSGSTFSYGVEAFNDIGPSIRRTTGSFQLSNCTNP